jgi:hypothetical protein
MLQIANYENLIVVKLGYRPHPIFNSTRYGNPSVTFDPAKKRA